MPHLRLTLLQVCVLVGLLATQGRAAAPAYRTENFVVRASTQKIAESVALAAEEYRRQLALDWLGSELPRWSARCRITVHIDHAATSGDTTYVIHRGEVYGWNMTVQGPLDRILDSVLPHEISHTVLASDFRGALPRWADEGAAVLSEGEQEIVRRQLRVGELLNARQIPMQALLSISEYPSNADELMLVYSQGYSLTQFLVELAGKRGFVQFLKDANEHGWEEALNRTYHFASIDSLDQSWREWMRRSDGESSGTVIAQRDTSARTETVSTAAQGD